MATSTGTGYDGVGTVKNILVGAAGVFISTADSTSPQWNAFFSLPVPSTIGPRASRRPVRTVSDFVSGDSGPQFTAQDWTPAAPTTNDPTGISAEPANAARYRNVGFTSEGLEVAYEPTYGDIEVDQLLDSAQIFKQQVRVTANTTFAEATLENLITVWGLANGTISVQNAGQANEERTLDIAAGALGEEPLERSMVFVGKGPRTVVGNVYRERVYHIKRAIQTESSSHALRRNEMTGLPASFRLLPDASASTATYGKIVERVIS